MYESRLPDQFLHADPGAEVLLVQTLSGVPAGYGRDHEVEVILDTYPNKHAAMEAVQRRGRLRDVIKLTWGDVRRVDLLVEVIRLTRVGLVVDEYRIFNV